MSNIKLFLIFAALILLQILVVSNIYIYNKISPYIYIMFIIIIPARMNRNLVMFLAFLSGLIIDGFYNTGGIHAASSVFVAFLRPKFLTILESRFDNETIEMPTAKYVGVKFFIYYAGTIVLIHNILIYSLELFHLKSFIYNFWLVIANSAISLLLILLIDYLFRKEK